MKYLTLTLLLATAPLHAAVIYSDSFTNSSPNRDAGDSLNGLTTEVGGGTWVGRNAFIFTGSGTIETGGPAGGTETRVMSVGTTITGGQIYTLKSSVVSPYLNLDTPGAWSAIGFANSPGAVFDSGFYNSPVGQLWMLLTKEGTYYVMSGTGTQLTTGTLSGFVSNAFYNLELDYDSGTNTASASINGSSVLTNYSLGFTPTINSAGFMFHRVEGAAVDNFELSATAAPEPSKTLFTAAGLGFLVLRRRRDTSPA